MLGLDAIKIVTESFGLAFSYLIGGNSVFTLDPLNASRSCKKEGDCRKQYQALNPSLIVFQGLPNASGEQGPNCSCWAGTNGVVPLKQLHLIRLLVWGLKGLLCS